MLARTGKVDFTELPRGSRVPLPTMRGSLRLDAGGLAHLKSVFEEQKNSSGLLFIF